MGSQSAPPFEQVQLSDAHVAALLVDQHEWTLVTVPLATWDSQVPGLGVILALILGLAGTGSASLYVHSTRRRAADLKNLTTELREGENRLQTIFASVREGIFVTDPDTSILLLEVNPAGCELFGYRRDRADRAQRSRVISSGEPGYTQLAILEQLKKGRKGEEAHTTSGITRPRMDALFWAEVSRNAVSFGGKNVLIATLTRIQPSAGEIREHLIDVARYDGLTGLVNRAAFLEALQQAAARARRGDHFFGVLYLDLDRFKDINDTLGHPIGDLVLKTVADRLRSNVRATDTVARFGGDEFALLAPELHDPLDAGVLALKLVEAISAPFVIQGNVIRTATSIGIAIFDIDSPIVETLLGHADLAMYRAETGRA